VPTWGKVVCIVFLVAFVANTWVTYGVINFLWLSNIGLIGTVAALVLEQRLLASMMLVLTLVPDGVAWTSDLVVALATGWHPLDATGYMFDETIPVRVRVMAIYHPVMAVVLVWLVARLGYDRRAMPYAAALASCVFVVTYAVTHPERNVNWVYGPGTTPQQVVAPWVYLLAVMLVVPTALFLPTHVLMRLLGWDHRAPREAVVAQAPS
jgi:hypothetical protein